jgi:hypothetical protein
MFKCIVVLSNLLYSSQYVTVQSVPFSVVEGPATLIGAHRGTPVYGSVIFAGVLLQ